MAFDAPTATAWITAAEAIVKANEARLTGLDAAIGDGDHGANMVRGLTAALANIAEKESSTPGDVLVAAGRGIIAKTGGASGPLYGTAFRRAGKALGDSADASADEVGAALEAALTAVKELGGANEGDKTMIDGLTPAVAAFERAVADGGDLAAATAAAADAAEAGLAATVPLQARKGRASYLGPRSVGHEDPGAASLALILRALAEVTA
jgi:phosphoenolpyruvate---glycerone phosphotransferase subunit DhaL